MEVPATEIPASQLLTEDINNIIPYLDKYGVCVVPLKNISTGTRNRYLLRTNFYQNANQILKDEYQIKELTLNEKIHPEKIVPRKAPDSSQGWINQYGMPIHHLIEQDQQFRDAISIVEGEPVSKFMQNRIRIGARNPKLDITSLHFDGLPFEEPAEDGSVEFTKNPLTATIIGLTGLRRFCWWDIKDKNLRPIYDHWVDKGQKHFTNIDPQFMSSTYQGCRRYVDVDCSKHIHLIIFRECIPHEIASSPSISIFISPIKNWDNTFVPTTSYHPPEYRELTLHGSNLLGYCYNRNGICWPSGKKSWPFSHIRAYTHWLCKIKPRYIRTNKNGKQTIMMQLPECGQYDQHSEEYKARLKERNIVLPAIAFKSTTPNFIVDIASLPESILRDHGFIL